MVALVFLCVLAVLGQPLAQAQTFHVLHSFTNGSDGASPMAGLTLGGIGTLYGTTAGGGNDPNGYGVVYKLSLHNSNWLLTPVYEFTNGSDGFEPMGGITIGPGGVPFGTANNGHFRVLGTVFSATPPLTVCKAVFGVLLDGNGNLFGTAYEGGTPGSCRGLGCGTIWEITP